VGLVIASPAYGLERYAAILIALTGVGAWFVGSALGYLARRLLDDAQTPTGPSL
jgi:hypothetical protein